MPANTGPVQLQALGRRLKVLGAAGNIGAAQGLGQGFGAGKTLRAQLLAGIRSAAKPLVEEARKAAREQLPRAGGLNDSVANSQIRVATRLAGPRVGVRITNRSHGGKGANRGQISHPVFGHRDRWVKQTDAAAVGWFDQTLRYHAPAAMVPIRASMEIIAIEATRRL